ncbi:PREDICTED: UPF0598 protein CG30010 isoform X1 [Cyphomyrmex costatus]|uniref:UPF0598 protein C8orf82 like protein n=2 Tax=Cyphomyrmex costatus TaxID=456900 RepID=A0A151I7N3_9HYME|nr:PREDICTED: UPF0598 protein CG30010 isoform X1 [Cyphomyrmex costatus]KYM94141.1 UPF0598 protein C8orf82 like protein [Cyphomyrmex costatus]
MTSILCMRIGFAASQKFLLSNILGRNYVTYIQGQSPQPRVREYFYYIDHQGMLFLDDVRIRNFTSCFKDKKFLAFFFKRMRKNDTEHYTDDFPFLSICGVERNYVRCDDLPLVFTKIIQECNVETGAEEDWFSYAHADDLLMMPFEPQRLFMNIKTGRVYHPAPEKIGGIGLVRSNLAIEFSALFNFENGEENAPTHFVWRNERYQLDTEWYKDKLS